VKLLPRAMCSSAIVTVVLLLAEANADPQPKVPRIGVLFDQKGNAVWTKGVREGLHQLGYLEGKTIMVEWRGNAETYEQMRLLAAELERSGVELIITAGSPATPAALEATGVPVVFTFGDPIAAGFAASLAHPGGRATGVSVLSVELYPKRLELLRELAPHARRIVFLRNPTNRLASRLLDALQEAGQRLGMQIKTLDARDAGEVNAALKSLRRNPPDAVIVSAEPLFLASKAQIAQAVRAAKLPAVFPWAEYHDEGVLMSYGPNLTETGRQMAGYVDKILRGAKPADLPIEQASTYELIIDLRIARAMGLHVPQSLLARANEVNR